MVLPPCLLILNHGRTALRVRECPGGAPPSRKISGVDSPPCERMNFRVHRGRASLRAARRSFVEIRKSLREIRSAGARRTAKNRAPREIREETKTAPTRAAPGSTERAVVTPRNREHLPPGVPLGLFSTLRSKPSPSFPIPAAAAWTTEIEVGRDARPRHGPPVCVCAGIAGRGRGLGLERRARCLQSPSPDHLRVKLVTMDNSDALVVKATE